MSQATLFVTHRCVDESTTYYHPLFFSFRRIFINLIKLKYLSNTLKNFIILQGTKIFMENLDITRWYFNEINSIIHRSKIKKKEE